MLRPIVLKELLKLPKQTTRLEFRQMIPDFDSLTPVEGWIKVTHRGHFLQVWGEVDTIVTLACIRCLQHFNHRLHNTLEEILWIEGSDTPLEDDLVESVDPNGAFDTQDWIYQHLCLALPNHRVCRDDCPPPLATTPPEETGDPRWAVLKQWTPSP
ncbi:MAG: DUF177 domain-containing protein [Synechococcales cyanobacterium]